jgi:hypothetical protein
VHCSSIPADISINNARERFTQRLKDKEGKEDKKDNEFMSGFPAIVCDAFGVCD